MEFFYLATGIITLLALYTKYFQLNYVQYKQNGDAELKVKIIHNIMPPLTETLLFLVRIGKRGMDHTPENQH